MGGEEQWDRDDAELDMCCSWLKLGVGGFLEVPLCLPVIYGWVFTKMFRGREGGQGMGCAWIRLELAVPRRGPLTRSPCGWDQAGSPVTLGNYTKDLKTGHCHWSSVLLIGE